jgi:hypothetical protein
MMFARGNLASRKKPQHPHTSEFELGRICGSANLLATEYQVISYKEAIMLGNYVKRLLTSILSEVMKTELMPELDKKLKAQEKSIRDFTRNAVHRNPFDLMRYYDVMNLLLPEFLEKKGYLDKNVTVNTEFPVAYDSPDHIDPAGAAHNNSRLPRFAYACEKLFDRPVRALDLGCAGGGLVLDFLLRGHFSVGIEGSDISMVQQRAEWRILGGKLLHTADISRDFEILVEGETGKFEVICMWEVLEHIPEDRLDTMFTNVKKHLAFDGVFVGSVAFTHSPNDKHYHQTVKPKEWWLEKFDSVGLELVQDFQNPDSDKEKLFKVHDFVRGTNQFIGYAPRDADISDKPNLGMHFIAKRKK